MKAGFVALLLLMAAFSWETGDGVCNRTAGESCMNSPDCSVCRIDLIVKQTLSDTSTTVAVELENREPAEVSVVLTMQELGEKEPLFIKAMDLKKFENARVEKRIERALQNRTFTVKVIDRELGTVWAQKQFLVPGMENTPGKVNPLVGIAGVAGFFAVLYFGLKGMDRERSPYVMPPMYAYPPPPQPQQPGEEIIVVTKKKKYYYEKK